MDVGEKTSIRPTHVLEMTEFNGWLAFRAASRSVLREGPREEWRAKIPAGRTRTNHVKCCYYPPSHP